MIARSMHADDLDEVLRLVEEQRRLNGQLADRLMLVQGLNLLLSRPELGAIYVLNDGRTIVGYAVGTVGFSLETGGRALVVNALYVRPVVDRQTLGPMLLDRLLAFARRAECSAVVLEPVRDEEELCHWYSRLGFQHRHREYCSANVAELSQRLSVA
jgi:GNAT superfamily N-acetyltransferase